MWSRTNGRCLTEGIEDPKWGAEVRRAQSLGEVGTAAQRSQSRKKGTKGSWEEAQRRHRHKYDTNKDPVGVKCPGSDVTLPRLR